MLVTLQAEREVSGWCLSGFAEERAEILEGQVSHKLMHGRVNI